MPSQAEARDRSALRSRWPTGARREHAEDPNNAIEGADNAKEVQAGAEGK
jgi:hypothetical protein